MSRLKYYKTIKGRDINEERDCKNRNQGKR